MIEDLETRVARQFSTLYLTLVSVLVGLVLSDLFSTIHARVVLFPLTLETARTWCQIFGNILSVLSAWVTYSHLGLLKSRLPTIWDTVDAGLVLVTIPLNAAVGRHESADWFFWSAAYLFLGIVAVKINVRQATREPSLRHLLRLGRFGGPWLAGDAFTAVDAFFAPVAFRIRTYGLDVGAGQAWVDAVLAHPAMQEWERQALAESWREESHEAELAAAGVITADYRTA